MTVENERTAQLLGLRDIVTTITPDELISLFPDLKDKGPNIEEAISRVATEIVFHEQAVRETTSTEDLPIVPYYDGDMDPIQTAVQEALLTHLLPLGGIAHTTTEYPHGTKKITPETPFAFQIRYTEIPRLPIVYGENNERFAWYVRETTVNDNEVEFPERRSIEGTLVKPGTSKQLVLRPEIIQGAIQQRRTTQQPDRRSFKSSRFTGR
jgi:hypothetical protein